MAPIIETTDERATKILDAAKVPYRLVEQPKPIQSEVSKQTTPNYEPDPSDYIFVPGIKSGKEKRPPLLVCKYRLSADSAVERVGRELGIRVENTAKERNGRDYTGNIHREQALKLNLFLGGRTLDVKLAKDFLALLFSGKAEDGNRKRVKSSELAQIADEITKPRSPWRAEWFEDYFSGNANKLN